MTGVAPNVPVQATAVCAAFTRSEMDELLRLAEKGIAELVLLQKKALTA